MASDELLAAWDKFEKTAMKVKAERDRYAKALNAIQQILNGVVEEEKANGQG